ncbi:MAG TPA: SDR family oxidoreductase [Candidatus Acidoferrum sp.]|nr:SDR family oxidoreductase [Candidatus Acidoferrum sp.]
MTSAHWDEAQAAAYREFRFEFPEKTLAGKTIIVAGGTGGLGAATAVLLAREGARLVVGFRHDRARAERLQAAIEREFKQKPALVEGDLSQASVRRSYIETAQHLGGPIAGAAIFSGDPARVPLQDLDREAILRSLESNYVGPVLLARDLGEAMEREAGGGIVLLTTMQALAAFPSSLNYAAPKAALVHAARILAQQWNRVGVNVVAPGATVAGMAAASVAAGKYDRHIASGVITRFGRPEDVARAVRFLLEPDGYINGETLLVDGGLTLRRDRG